MSLQDPELLDVQAVISHFGDQGCYDVYTLHHKFGFPRSLVPRMLPHEDMMGRYRFMLEELNEFKDSLDAGDLSKMWDALLDLVYVAKGTAVQLGLPWGMGWYEVHSANMRKIKSPQKTDRGHDLLKPPDWTPPDAALEALLPIYGYQGDGS